MRMRMMVSLEKPWHDWNRAVFAGESHTLKSLWQQPSRAQAQAETVQLMDSSRWRLLSPVMPEPLSVKRNYIRMKA